MRDVHQRGSVVPRQVGQHRQQHVAALLVDHAGDLVGDQQRRLAGQCGRDGQTLQLATGQSTGVPVGHATQPDLTQ